MRKKALGILVVCFLGTCFAGCGTAMEDGYYTAEMAEYEHGWKEYLCIQVKDNNIVSAEYNAKNESGFIKAWDNNYMKNMLSSQDTYPNKYTREYVKQLLENQELDGIEAISGASHSGDCFKKLVEAAIGQARKGDSNVKVVE